ncbi:MAG: substrate-binding domain-containing protein [Opitutales bacterium]|nr:substrate-binding domain-containing protein [Opitutales bacterium]
MSHLPPTTIGLTGMTMQGVEAKILEAIQKYAHTHNWHLFNGNTPNGKLEMFRNHRLLSGVIAVVADDEMHRTLRKFDCPVINISDTFPEKYQFPSVLSDDQRIGSLAAEYFLSRGYRNFAVHLPPGLHPYRYLNTRSQAYMKALEESGFGCFAIADLLDQQSYNLVQKAGFLIRSFRDLPKPCAVFCSDDQIASHCCFVAQTKDIDLQIPQELAVLGVDNFELHCNMSSPPLSSIDVNPAEIGKTAAEKLHQLIEGTGPSNYFLQEVPPGDVVMRNSAFSVAIEDIHLARAIQFILDHCHERINVADIVRASGINRRKLEILFRKTYQCSILHELNLARIKRVKKLRRDTDLPLYKIAALSGFRDSHQMSRVFKRHGVTL